MKILLAGPAGSGKTTQAGILSQKLGIDFVNTGNLLREIAQQDTDEGRIINKALDAGEFVDNELVGKIIKNKLQEPQFKNGYITDGYPRNLDQLKIFDPRYNIVVYLDVPDSVVLERLLKRGREDDTLDVISQRLKLYHESTEDVLDYYQKQGKLFRISANKPVQEVTEEIFKKVNEVI